MKHRNRLLKYRKAQFFVLSAFAIISVLYLLSRWIEPSAVTDTSQIALVDEPFIFNNIKEKAEKVVQISKDCDDLKFNLEEYKQFVGNYAREKNYLLILTYTYPTCTSGITVNFNMKLISTRMELSSDFSVACTLC